MFRRAAKNSPVNILSHLVYFSFLVPTCIYLTFVYAKPFEGCSSSQYFIMCLLGRPLSRHRAQKPKMAPAAFGSHAFLIPFNLKLVNFFFVFCNITVFEGFVV